MLHMLILEVTKFHPPKRLSTLVKNILAEGGIMSNRVKFLRRGFFMRDFTVFQLHIRFRLP